MIAPRRLALGLIGRIAAALLALAATTGAIASCASHTVWTTSAASSLSSMLPSPSTSLDVPTPISGAASPASPQAVFASAVDLPTCRTGQLDLRSADVVPETGEHAFSIWIKNTGEPCALIGYPSVRLLDERGTPLPVRYHHGGSYTTTQPPRDVVLPTGAEAVVVVAKYRCDLGPGQPATSAQIVLPVATTANLLPIIGNLDYCGANGEGGADDVSVSPIEPDYTDAVGQYP